MSVSVDNCLASHECRMALLPTLANGINKTGDGLLTRTTMRKTNGAFGWMRGVYPTWGANCYALWSIWYCYNYNCFLKTRFLWRKSHLWCAKGQGIGHSINTMKVHFNSEDGQLAIATRRTEINFMRDFALTYWKRWPNYWISRTKWLRWMMAHMGLR